MPRRAASAASARCSLVPRKPVSVSCRRTASSVVWRCARHAVDVACCRQPSLPAPAGAPLPRPALRRSRGSADSHPARQAARRPVSAGAIRYGTWRHASRGAPARTIKAAIRARPREHLMKCMGHRSAIVSSRRRADESLGRGPKQGLDRCWNNGRAHMPGDGPTPGARA